MIKAHRVVSMCWSNNCRDYINRPSGLWPLWCSGGVEVLYWWHCWRIKEINELLINCGYHPILLYHTILFNLYFSGAIRTFGPTCLLTLSYSQIRCVMYIFGSSALIYDAKKGKWEIRPNFLPNTVYVWVVQCLE